MTPRPAPDISLRRTLTIQAARDTAEAAGWDAVTMRGLAAQLGLAQPALYAVFDSRQAIVDAVALQGFEDLAASLLAAQPNPQARAAAYLSFAAAHPQVYEAMFALPSDLTYGSETSPDSMWRAFESIRGVFPGADETFAELAWATLHGLATLQAANRLRPAHLHDRLDLFHHLFNPKEANS
jgi:AcrR family transcriptional regulator